VSAYEHLGFIWVLLALAIVAALFAIFGAWRAAEDWYDTVFDLDLTDYRPPLPQPRDARGRFVKRQHGDVNEWKP
jgi:hypothetical protein